MNLWSSFSNFKQSKQSHLLLFKIFKFKSKYFIFPLLFLLCCNFVFETSFGISFSYFFPDFQLEKFLKFLLKFFQKNGLRDWCDIKWSPRVNTFSWDFFLIKHWKKSKVEILFNLNLNLFGLKEFYLISWFFFFWISHRFATKKFQEKTKWLPRRYTIYFW